MLSEKGKYATATQNRRTVWEKIIWPLILEIDDVTFSVKQYQKKRDEMMQKNNFKVVELDKKRNRGSQYEKCNFLVVGK